MEEDYEKLLAELIAEETSLMENFRKAMEKEEQEFSKFYEDLLNKEKETYKDLDL